MVELVYLDHAATTPVRAEVLEAMTPFFGPRFGNPSSVHRWGREARVALDEARERVAACIGAHSDEICFTSCGTEGDNFAILGAWRAARATGRRAVVTTQIEHKAVLGAVDQAAAEGAESRWLAVDGRGIVQMASVDAQVRDDVAVCSVMWVNNEIGCVQDVPTLAERSRARGVTFHTDAVQAFGKLAIDAGRQPFDLLTLSGHKLGAPKGVGALYIRRGTALEPLLHGGAQDRGRRPGTENVAFAVGLARAAELAVEEREVECARLVRLRDGLEAVLLARIPDAVIHARGGPRAPHIVSVSVPGTDAESLLMALDMAGVAASSGSACQSGDVNPSHVLTAIGVGPELSIAAVRMSLGALTTEDGIARVAELFPTLVNKARRLSGSPT
jgi:cysteine desulfurase